jgi:DNA-directed RNA polymerase specialized sigma24 family protein
MSIDDTVTEWIQQLKAGDSAAAEKLWHRYFRQLVEQARRKLEGARRAAADEEDVALSAFKSFCVGAQDGRFPRVSDRDSLWSLLLAITAHKSVDLIRHQNRQKRGGLGVDQESGGHEARPIDAVALSAIAQEQPTHAIASLA